MRYILYCCLDALRCTLQPVVHAIIGPLPRYPLDTILLFISISQHESSRIRRCVDIAPSQCSSMSLIRSRDHLWNHLTFRLLPSRRNEQHCSAFQCHLSIYGFAGIAFTWTHFAFGMKNVHSHRSIANGDDCSATIKRNTIDQLTRWRLRLATEK